MGNFFGDLLGLLAAALGAALLLGGALALGAGHADMFIIAVAALVAVTAVEIVDRLWK